MTTEQTFLLGSLNLRRGTFFFFYAETKVYYLHAPEVTIMLIKLIKIR